MADKIKMAAKPEFSITQSIFMQFNFETWDLERTSIKKYSRSNFFSKLQNGGHFFCFGSHTVISQLNILGQLR
jgi:hypothetical protein